MNIDKNELLIKAKELLKEQMTKISYTTWVKDLQIKSVKDNKIILVALLKMHKEAIEGRLIEDILKVFNFLTNKECEIEIIEKTSENINAVEEQENNKSNIKNYSNSFLNPNYTFENFVVGDNNKFAHAAAIAVSKEAISEYNPLFIYGNVGLGKTHLMHAIGNKILENDLSMKVLYVTSEKFINDLVKSIQDKNYKTELFRDKYRNIDVLLIDDIQFLANKKMGQEEFFNTFNELHQNGKRIIISSDRPPRDMECLEERLKGRFNMGILADIAMPDYETRLAIIKRKVQTEKVIIDDNILSLIATKIDTNVRDLEGILNKITAYCSLTHTPITIEIAEKAINDIILQKEKIISIEYIKEMVAKYFNIDKKDLVSSKKSNDIAFPRQIAMYLCRTTGQMSFPQIAKEFGNRDHTTVIHSVKKIEKEIKEKNSTKLVVESLKNIILDKNN